MTHPQITIERPEDFTPSRQDAKESSFEAGGTGPTSLSMPMWLYAPSIILRNVHIMLRIINILLLIISFAYLSAPHSVGAAEGRSNCPLSAKSQSPDTPKPKRTIHEDWKDVEIELLKHDGTKRTTTHAKRIKYLIDPVQGGHEWLADIVVIADPELPQPWIGFSQDVYLETETGIVGLRLKIWWTYLHWSESLIEAHDCPPMHKANIGHLTRLVSEQLTGERLLLALETPAASEIRWENYTDLPLNVFGMGSSAPGMPTITSARYDKGVVDMKVTNESGTYTGEVWIDAKTREVIKKEEPVSK